MKDQLFSKILADAERKGIKTRTSNSMSWFRQHIRNNIKGQVKIQTLTRSKEVTIKPRMTIGKMYIFGYDAKHKATLPYWDAVPLIFPIEDKGNTILGLNLHYLPLRYRARLLDALYDLANNDKYDQSTKLRLTYQLLSSARKYRLFKPCIKQYLKSNFMSRFIEIPSNLWEVAIFLPVADWQNGSIDDVYKDSMQTIGK